MLAQAEEAGAFQAQGFESHQKSSVAGQCLLGFLLINFPTKTPLQKVSSKF